MRFGNILWCKHRCTRSTFSGWVLGETASSFPFSKIYPYYADQISRTRFTAKLHHNTSHKKWCNLAEKIQFLLCYCRLAVMMQIGSGWIINWCSFEVADDELMQSGGQRSQLRLYNTLRLQSPRAFLKNGLRTSESTPMDKNVLIGWQILTPSLLILWAFEISPRVL